jgi:hypothetical protein
MTMFDFTLGTLGFNDSNDFDRDHAEEVAARAMESQLELLE